MGNSHVPGATGQVPWAASPRTPGPLGTNGDAGDPATPSWFVGDTPGPVGHNDHADPNGTMCRMRPARSTIADYVEQEHATRRRNCEMVKRELRETYRIRDAFADAALLKQARDADWSTAEFDAKVKEKLFGPPIEGQVELFVSPMGTNPQNCRIQENWSIEKYRSEGFPDVIYEADRAHEAVHSASCNTLSSADYSAAMSFPDKFSKDEVKAYTAKIAVLEKWLHANCR
jgi:hypothetical protein